MEYTLVKEENINEKLNLLKKEREIKREKYKLYLFLSFLLLASCIFIFWLYEKNVKDTAIINSDFSENLVGTKQLDKSFVSMKKKKQKFEPYFIFYRFDMGKNRKFCNVTFEPYFNRPKDFDINEVIEGHHYFGYQSTKDWVNRQYKLLMTKHWKPTNDLKKPIDALLEGRWEQKPEAPNDLTIAKRFTVYDGFINEYVGKADNDNALRSLLDSHSSCDFKYIQSFNLVNVEPYDKFCEDRKKHPEKQYLVKYDHSQHGIGMHIISAEKMQKICRRHKRHPEKPYKMILSEFQHTPALIKGYKFHARWMGFVIADPFVTYWAPRHSYLRFANEKYGTDDPEQYITNESNCNAEMSCIQYDSQFVGKDSFPEHKWKKAVNTMTRMSHMITKAYYGRQIFDGKTSKNRFTWLGFDYMFDTDFNPIFTEWNEEAGLRNSEVPEQNRRVGNFFDGMLSIANGYVKNIPQKQIDGFSIKYQLLKAKTIDDGNDWMKTIQNNNWVKPKNLKKKH